MRLYLDTEFNGFGGQLISIALVSEDGKEFYVLANYPQHGVHPWVKTHVLPVIGDEMYPVTKGELLSKLVAFLNNWDSVEIIADWPQDLQHFFESLYLDDMILPIPDLTTRLDRGYKRIKPEIPHNALSDAKAFMLSRC